MNPSRYSSPPGTGLWTCVLSLVIFLLGAPAASAVCKLNANVAGTKRFISYPFAATSYIYNTTVLGKPGLQTYTFAFEYLIASGSALQVTPGTGVTNSDYNTFTITLYFEELRLPWQF